MRLARLAAVGLAIGVIVGFAIALLRSRPSTSSTLWEGADGSSGDLRDESAGDELWQQFRRAEESPAIQLRTARRVKG